MLLLGSLRKKQRNWFLEIEHRENKRSHWNSWLYTAAKLYTTRKKKNTARVTRTSVAEANGKRAWNIYRPRSGYRNNTRVSRENQFASDHRTRSSDYYPLLFLLFFPIFPWLAKITTNFYSNIKLLSRPCPRHPIVSTTCTITYFLFWSAFELDLATWHLPLRFMYTIYERA